MKINKIKIGMFLLVGLFLICFVSSASYSRSIGVQYAQPGSEAFSNNYWQPYDSSMCEAGQDFVIQIEPFGCEPAVVRSDLLEEQNFPVMCKLGATKINPLIEVDAIESMTFSGKYTDAVAGVGFYPAKAALGGMNNLNSPVFNNIGYAVIVLREQANASAMPDFVEGNLTARITYDIKNAFGIGDASFYLPEMNFEDWERKHNQYSFWGGRFYLRAESVDTNGAMVSIYDDTRKISSMNLRKGETSQTIYLPGFDCLAGLKLKLNGLENPDTRARLDINGEIVEVADNERFLENRCWVKEINKKGIVQEVIIGCNEDEGVGLFGSNSFPLKISPKINLEFEGADEEGYEVGDQLYPIDEDGSKFVYVGYIGETPSGVYYIIPVVSPEKTKEDFMRSSTFRALPDYVKTFTWFSGNLVVDVIKTIGSLFYVGGANALNWVVTGEAPVGFIYEEDSGKGTAPLPGYSDTHNILGKIKFKGFAGPKDEVLGEGEKNYKNAMTDYDIILDSFSSEKYNNITFGEEALYRKVILAIGAEQKITSIDLCQEFKSSYPNSKHIKELYNGGKGECDNLAKLSSSETSSVDVLINGVIKRITFNGISEPDFNDYGAEVYIAGKSGDEEIDQRGIHLIKGMKLPLLDDDYVELKEIGEDYIIVNFQVELSPVQIASKVYQFGTDTKIKLNDYVTHVGKNDYKFGVTKVNLKKSAKVSVISKIDNAGTEANFSFKIGIEKRSIKLSPEMTAEKIKDLNKTIAEWTETSGKIGNVVQGLKAACLGVGTMMVAKNFLSNTGGQAIARQNVMRGEGGINDMCTDAINKKEGALWKSENYQSLNDCFTDQADYIDGLVDDYYKELDKQNNEIKLLQKPYETTSFMGTEVDTDKLGNAYIPEVQTELRKTLKIGNEIDVGGGKMVAVSEIINMINTKSVSIEQARILQLNSRLNPNKFSMTQSQLNKTLIEIYVNNQEAVEKSNFALETGFPEVHMSAPDKDTKTIQFTKDIIWSSIKNNYIGNTVISDNVNVQNYVDRVSGQGYILVLNNDNLVTKTYLIDSTLINRNPTSGKIESISNTLKLYEGEDVNNPGNPLKLIFEKHDTSYYENKYEDYKLKYYETEPYKGLPAIVPVDLNRGWYASISQTLPVLGNIGSYQDSGAVSSFSLCNVGENGREENKRGDDECTGVNRGTDQIGGLDDTEAKKIVACAFKAVEQASQAHKSGVKKVSISTSCGKFSVDVGSPAVDIPDMQCQDFMSPKDCQLMFNVCDPVICPSSRCDFGGDYPVRDVIQSGIIGSIALCLPNYREGIYIPVCLSGIKAGIDGLLSVFTSYRDCLQESLDTGQMVGICDEIYSIHLCDFFWRQTLPMANLIIPKVMEMVMGQNVRGGGEYLGVASAWTNAGDSMEYFTQYYAAEAYSTFKARVVESVSDAACNVFISGSYPDGGDLLSSLTTPDSPPQFHGRFDEIKFTTATVPPISHYKVYYHVYAGQEQRAYYKIYLKTSAGSSYYQDNALTRFVDSGYIATGGYASETVDFTAPSGYNQMCIMVNEQEECGFQEVSTSFAIDYVKDEYIKQQAGQTDIQTEKECVGGTVSAYSLLNPNLEAAAGELIDPAIYDRGIIRVCATINPGKGTDGLGKGEGARWVEVGSCGQDNMRCWLDSNSVKDAVNFEISSDTVLGEHANSTLEMLKAEGKVLSDKVYAERIEEKEKLMGEGKYNEVIDLVNKNLNMVWLNSKKSKLLLNRGMAYAGLVLDGISRLNLPPEEEMNCNERCNSVQGTNGLKIDSEDCRNDYGGEEDDSEESSQTWLWINDYGCCCSPEISDEDVAPPTPTGGNGGEENIEVRIYPFDNERTQTEVIVSLNAIPKYAKCVKYIDMVYDEDGFKYSTKISDPLLLFAIMMQESSCDQEAESSADCVGLMQIQEKTFKDVCTRAGFGYIDSFEKVKGDGNEQNNIECGLRILGVKDNWFGYSSCDANHPCTEHLFLEKFASGYTNAKCVDGTCVYRYKCGDKDVYYSKQEAALRAYNGWACSGANPHYVEEVMEKWEELDAVKPSGAILDY